MLPFDKKATKEELELAVKYFGQKKDICVRATKEHKDGTRLDTYLSIYPILNQNQLTGFFFWAGRAKKFKNAVCLEEKQKSDAKRTFREIRKIIMFALTQGRMTINQVSIKSGINWKTVEKHLTYLIGKGFVEEVFSSEYVRIFELTQKGVNRVEDMRRETIASIVKHEEEKTTIELREG